jgi:glycerophosphoryl diester phosphodiesterase
MHEKLIIAHRGGKALGAENTILTMKKGLAAGANAVEFDVHATLNHEPVVIHDPTLDRTTSGQGEVARLSLQQVQRYHAGDNQRVPSLVEVLDELANTGALIFIDLKHPRAALPTGKLVDHYTRNKGYMQGQIVIISALHQLLAMVHQAYPRIVTGAGLAHLPEGLAASGEYTNSHYILPSIDILNEALIEDARRRRLRVLTWTCDTVEQIARANKLGADGIITSDPTLAKVA